MSASKHWAITATHSPAGLSFEKDGQAIEATIGANASLSPVEFLLLSAAGCMALSLKAAALAAGSPVTAFRVVASGTKPAIPPSRLSDVDLRVSLIPSVPASDAAQLIADAQQMCTVTNTIRDSARFTVGMSDAASSRPLNIASTTATGDPA